MSWDHTFDLVVVGSGAAGLAAALRAHDLGQSVVVLEAAERYGGSTAISGGVVWIPNNPQLPSHGIPDSREDALTYLMEIRMAGVTIIELYFGQYFQKCIIHGDLSGKITTMNLLELGGHS